MTDTILINANVTIAEPEFQKKRLIAIENGKITAVTHCNALKNLRNKNTTIIDCRGKTVTPGFIDPHVHLRAFAESLVTLKLSHRDEVRSISDLQTKIQILARELPPGNWIRGKGYDEFHLVEKRHPNRWDLDAAAPAHPIKLTHRSGHCHVLNSLALQYVGISRQTAEPDGGMIDRDISSGEPTGLLYDMIDFLYDRIPPVDKSQLEQGLKLANHQLISLGVTSIQDATFTNDIEKWNELSSWKSTGELKPRTSVMLGSKWLDEYGNGALPVLPQSDRLRLNGIKIMLTESAGHLYPPQGKLNELVVKAHSNGLQVAIHAVEENAIYSACNAIENALLSLPRSDHRHRIEHCSICNPSLARRLASRGMMVVTQPPFVYYYGDRYINTVPKKEIRYLYPLKTLLRNGLKVAASSDCPIVPPNPLISIFSAVSRMSETGDVVVPEERINSLEALQMYTRFAALSMFEEQIKGSISPGKLADLVVLDSDPALVRFDNAEELKNISVEMTIIDGEVVWIKNENTFS